MIDHLTETQIKELARLEAAATKVLWWVEQCKPGQGAQAKTDFDFICAARSAIAPLLAERTALMAENLKLRRMVAISYSGTHLYRDDGELQDVFARPHIDFKHDAVDEIVSKIQERGRIAAAALAAGQGQGKERE